MLRRFLSSHHLRREIDIPMATLLLRTQQTFTHLESIRSSFEQVSIDSSHLLSAMHERKVSQLDSSVHNQGSKRDQDQSLIEDPQARDAWSKSLGNVMFVQNLL
jgi:hypothetical protein